MDLTRDRGTTIAQIAESEEDRARLQEHLQEIVEGSAFRGSGRCGRFLTYIVAEAIAGRFESLKERVIGVEVFGRSSDYNTSEDAIVRVTASDVRKRLQQHYLKNGTASRFHISLPVGSYVPEITCDPHTKRDQDQSDTRKARQNSPLALFDSATSRENSSPALPAVQSTSIVGSGVQGSEIVVANDHSGSRLRKFTWALAILSLLLASLSVVLGGIVRKDAQRANAAPVSVLPWSALFNSQHLTHLITSDPNLVSIQQITGSRISLLDYVNHNYVPEHNNLTPEKRQILQNFPHGDWAAPGDTQIAVNIAELAQSSSRKIDVQPASKTQLSALKTDDNFIFLGSPRSDPWVSLFNDRLDFQFLTVDGSQKEVIRNTHPRPNEQSIYTPTTGTTGESFAIIAFVQNPDQDGQVLILAGATGEGTEIAGRLVTDLPRLSTALRKCGSLSSGSFDHFELLLRVNVMAGSSRGFDVAACHILPGTSAH